MKKTHLISCIFIFLSLIVFSQNRLSVFSLKTDSLMEINKFQEANASVNQSISFLRTNPNNNLGDLYYKKALIYKNKGDFDSSIIYLDSAFIEYEPNTNKSELAICHLLRGKVYNKLGNHIDALREFSTAIITFIHTNDSLHIAIIKLNIGHTYRETNKNEAIQNYKEAIYYFNLLKKDDRLASAYNSLGILYRKFNQIDSTKYYFRKALNIRIKQNDNFLLAHSFHNYSNLFMILEQYDSALVYIDEAINYQLKDNNLSSIRKSYFVKGEIFHELKNYEKTIVYMKKSLEGERYIYTDLFLFGNLRLAECYNHFGMYKESAYHYGCYVLTNDSIQKRRIQIYLKINL